MFRVPILVAIGLVIAFGGGIWSAIRALEATQGFGAIRLGVWEAFPDARKASADPYAKAHRASAGKLLYASAEGLTFTASHDDSGQRLTSGCHYRISGHVPPARFWTLFAMGRNGQPPAADADLPLALNSRMVLYDRKGDFAIDISSQARPMNWLAIPPEGQFQLILTLFDTPTAGSSGLIDLTMPKLEKTGCGGNE